MRRGQTAIEFLVTFTAAALIFLVFSMYIAQQFVFFFNVSAGNDQAQHVADRLCSEINRAYLLGDGYRGVFTLPATVAGMEYSHAMDSTGRIIEIYVEERPEWHGSSRHLAGEVAILGIGSENLVVNSGGAVSVRPVR